MQIRSGSVAGLVARLPAATVGAVLAGCARYQTAPAASPAATATPSGDARSTGAPDSVTSALDGVDDLIKSIDAAISGQPTPELRAASSRPAMKKEKPTVRIRSPALIAGPPSKAPPPAGAGAALAASPAPGTNGGPSGMAALPRRPRSGRRDRRPRAPSSVTARSRAESPPSTARRPRSLRHEGPDLDPCRDPSQRDRVDQVRSDLPQGHDRRRDHHRGPQGRHRQDRDRLPRLRAGRPEVGLVNGADGVMPLAGREPPDHHRPPTSPRPRPTARTPPRPRPTSPRPETRT